MAGSTATKCPICGKSVAVGLVSGTLIQHENKHGERCEGTGMAPVVALPRASSSGSGAARAPRTGAAGGASSAAHKPSSGTSITNPASGTPASSRSAAPSRRGVTVRKVEVDQDRLRAREEKMERLRQEREARARARNEIYVSGIGPEAEDSEAESLSPEADAADAERGREADAADESRVNT